MLGMSLFMDYRVRNLGREVGEYFLERGWLFGVSQCLDEVVREIAIVDLVALPRLLISLAGRDDKGSFTREKHLRSSLIDAPAVDEETLAAAFHLAAVARIEKDDFPAGLDHFCGSGKHLIGETVEPHVV